MASGEHNLHITWPLREDDPADPFPADPYQAVTACAPPSQDLHALEKDEDFTEPSDRPTESPRRSAAGTLPPGAPEWMQAARALSQKLEQAIQRGTVDPEEYSAIARAWAAWSLGGISPAYVLRVAHLVTRAHTAIREVRAEGAQLDAAYRHCAGVLHGGLPSVIRNRMPYERMALVVRHLRHEVDQWSAVVEVTSELLGWKDYARQHAAAVIRTVIEQRSGR
ncbi:MAG TPA: hypothetical protein VI072_07950 [Polyangiaceae bacterium]